MLALASIVCAQHKRTRHLQPALHGLDPLSSEGPTQHAPAGKRHDRVGWALRAWSAERAHGDLVVFPRTAEPECTPESEPKPELRATAPTPQSRPTSEPSTAREDRFTAPPETLLSQNAEYYEVLQISPNADPETIHRVYRIMAARFHPDNPTTGSLERFLLLREAYQTLSDPVLRAEYDASRPRWQTETLPIFWQKSFVDGIEGETNRRLGVLSLLYQRRRINESKPGISVMELERRMAFPREYLNFTLWYLRSKGYVAIMEDDSDYAVTSAGVDFVESCSAKNKVIRELLSAGTGTENTQWEERAMNVRRRSPRLARELRPEPVLRAVISPREGYPRRSFRVGVRPRI
jgi:hypothetical protein